jgi:hypothetical protein
MPKPRCYMCANRATSREHVPPRNLFPEIADSNGKNHRVNLITVASCAEHNSSKSHDDEFLMVSLAGIIGNNSIGYAHKLGKVDRAIKLSANRLLNEVLLEKKEIHQIELDSGKFLEVIWGTPDIKRLEKCFEHIAHGLHQHHFKNRFIGKINTLLGYLSHHDHNAKTWARFIRDRAEIDLKDKPKLGSNQEIFFYQVTDADQFGIYLMRLCFYGGLDIYISFTPATSSPPPSLAAELMGQGMQTILSLGENYYEFNPRAKT